MLPYAVVQQMQRLDAGLPLQDPREVNSHGDGQLVVTATPTGPRILRHASTSAFSPVARASVADEPVPDSTVSDDFGSCLTLADMAAYSDEVADAEVRVAMQQLTDSGSAVPPCSPDLVCYESSMDLEESHLPFGSDTRVLCDRCGHNASSPSFCPRCQLEAMCNDLGRCGFFGFARVRRCVLSGSD